MSGLIPDAKRAIGRGDVYPFDAPDTWWNKPLSDLAPPPPPKDWAHRAARGIVADLTDRHGFKGSFTRIDEDVRVRIVEQLAEIIREAVRQEFGDDQPTA